MLIFYSFTQPLRLFLRRSRRLRALVRVRLFRFFGGALRHRKVDDGNVGCSRISRTPCVERPIRGIVSSCMRIMIPSEEISIISSAASTARMPTTLPVFWLSA